MKPALLLVTWIVSGQPPSSYQAEFNSIDACEKARATVLAENARLQEQQNQKTAAMEAWTRVHGGVYAPGDAPSVSAVCVER
jgi:hypothetical protein